MTIQTWIDRTTRHFRDEGVPSAWLDTLLILEHVSAKDKAWLLAHSPESITHMLTISQLEQLVAAVARRANKEPVAYITGFKEFYGLQLAVNKHVLIPRPESEDIISLLNDCKPSAGQRLLDVGTGSGALAITAKTQYPQLIVTASDVSKKALAVAKQNANTHNANMHFIHSHLLNDIQEKQDYIVANLPYVPPDHPVNSDVLHEPALAVFSEHGGLLLIEELLQNASQYLNDNGYVFIESLPSQMKKIARIAEQHNLAFVKHTGLIQVFQYSK